jgi:hypothetical protein
MDEMNLLSLIKPWLDTNYQITMKSTTVTFRKIFRKLNKPLVRLYLRRRKKTLCVASRLAPWKFSNRVIILLRENWCDFLASISPTRLLKRRRYCYGYSFPEVSSVSLSEAFTLSSLGIAFNLKREMLLDIRMNCFSLYMMMLHYSLRVDTKNKVNLEL